MPHRKNTKLETIDEEINNVFTPEVINVDEQKDDSNDSKKKEKRTS